MGSRIRKLCLLIILFTFMHVTEPSAPLHDKPLHSESLQDIELNNEHQHGNKNDNGYNHGRRGLVQGSKFSRGGLASGGRPEPTGSSENGNNGGSSSPYGRVPIYAGGAAINHHPTTRHGAGNSIHSGMGLLALIFTAFTSLLHLYTEY